jgi:hypothetical protein
VSFGRGAEKTKSEPSEDVTVRDDDDPGFAAWCIAMCLARLRRRLRDGLTIGPLGRATLRRLDHVGTPAKNSRAMAVRLVEREDVSGQRWARALDLLLDAGRA